MTESKGSWSSVAEQLDALALKLQLHMEQAGDGGVPEALHKLREGVQGAFEAAGNAVKDDAVRSDVRQVGVLLAGAISSTLSKAAEDVRGAVRRTTS